MQLHMTKNKKIIADKTVWYITVYGESSLDEMILEVMDTEPTKKDMEETRQRLFSYYYIFQKFSHDKLYIAIK